MSENNRRFNWDQLEDLDLSVLPSSIPENIPLPAYSWEPMPLQISKEFRSYKRYINRNSVPASNMLVCTFLQDKEIERILRLMKKIDLPEEYSSRGNLAKKFLWYLKISEGDNSDNFKAILPVRDARLDEGWFNKGLSILVNTVNIHLLKTRIPQIPPFNPTTKSTLGVI